MEKSAQTDAEWQGVTEDIDGAEAQGLCSRGPWESERGFFRIPIMGIRIFDTRL